MINLIKSTAYFLLLLSILFSNERGWTHPETGWEVLSGTDMCILMGYNIYIDNEFAEYNQRDVLGVFYNDTCIGWAYISSNITIIPTIGNDGDNPQYPSDGDIIQLKVYDDSKNIILDIQTIETLPLWYVNTMSNINNMFACSYNLSIQDDGSCIDSCNYDPNGDENIDIFDIIFLMSNYILCDECNASGCGDINSDELTNIEDITSLLNIILQD